MPDTANRCVPGTRRLCDCFFRSLDRLRDLEDSYLDKHGKHSGMVLYRLQDGAALAACAVRPKVG